MSAGGVFKLIANDGKADRMILASELLNSRIKEIMCQRADRGFSDPTPTLVDIERTHILFVNAHFKPFAAVGCEYNKVRTSSGTSQFGGTVQFSIPQFGDFFNDMVVNVSLSTVTTTAGTCPALPAAVIPLDAGVTDNTYDATGAISTALGTMTQRITHNTVATTAAGTINKYTQKYVDLAGTVLFPGSTVVSNYVRYAEYPGQRLFKRVKFEVNGNPLDEYTSEAYMFYQKFRVGPHKMTGWKRLLGQEVPVDAVSDMVSGTGITNYNVGAAATSSTGYPLSYTESGATIRRLTQVLNGPQTPKLTQPALDLWIPLLFWFNTDTRLSIPSVSIPFGQRFINIDLETQANMVFTAPGNLFLHFEHEAMQVVATAGLDDTEITLVAPKSVVRKDKYVTLTPVLATTSVVSTTQTISTMELYINNIFVNPEIHDIYIKRIGFSLIRVHLFQSKRLSTAEGNIHLNTLKWPIETIFLGFRPTFNISSTNTEQYKDWHQLTLQGIPIAHLTSKSIADSMVGAVAAGAAGATNDTLTATAGGNTLAIAASRPTYTSQITSERLSYTYNTEVVDQLKLEAHGISIFQQTKVAFFSDYLPYTYGGQNIVTPEDPGAYMINFCLHPGSYQPSGHINVSRAREFYLSYTSTYIGTNTPVDLLVLGIALNFVLISDGGLMLRYTT